MFEQLISSKEVLIAIAMMASIVYLSRVGGYLLGLQVRHIGGLRPVLEALPGCAFMAILVPAVRQGNVIEIIALLCVIGLMWKTNSVVLATATGMTVLVLGESALEMMNLL
ncbi:MAG: putative membrane protein [Gammaproteobacteria bacterium]|jgi:uncharacterized membrane protein